MTLLNKFLLFIFFSSFCLSCRNEPDESAELKKENIRLRRQIDSLRNLMPAADTTPVENEGQTSSPGSSPDTDGKLRPGRHAFTLQWISWAEPGSVNIMASNDGWYSIKGSQQSRENKDFINIEGLIKQVSATELLFKGEIKSVVESINNGEPCVRTGEQIFKTTKNRKYWRLQDMINCEGGMLTDYVDIYFE